MDLPKDVQEKIERLSGEADALSEDGDATGAAKKLRAALALLPEPRDLWDAASWLHTALGDAELERDRLREARDAFAKAAAHPAGGANPYVQLRLGQVLFELGDEDDAAEALAKAAMAGGVTVFAMADRLDLLEVVDRKLRAPEGYESWIEYAESMDWQDAEQPAGSAQDDASGSIYPANAVDEFSSDEQRVSEEQAEFWRANRLEDIGRVRDLIQRVDVNAVIPGGLNRDATALELATLTQNPELVRVLLDAGADPNSPAPNAFPLHNGVITWQVAEMLLKAGAQIETRDQLGRTPLFMAAEGGDVESVRMLLERGADVHTSIEGMTLWEAARERDDREILDLLKRAGANRRK